MTHPTAGAPGAMADGVEEVVAEGDKRMAGVSATVTYDWSISNRKEEVAGVGASDILLQE